MASNPAVLQESHAPRATRTNVDRVRGVLAHKGKYLLAQHNSRHSEHRGKWGLPGGRLELEHPMAGLRRELMEELGYRVPYLVELGDWQCRGENHRVFGCEIQHAVDSFDTDELSAIGWFSLAEVRSLAAASRLHTGFELAAIKAFRRLAPDAVAVASAVAARALAARTVKRGATSAPPLHARARSGSR